jgi:hypothetical protein
MMASYPDSDELLAQVNAAEKNRLDFCLQALRRVDEAVGHADNKCATLGGANIGLISLLLAFVALAGDKVGQTLTPQQVTLVIVLFLLYLIPSVGSLIFAFDALFPRLRSKSTSLFYFGRLGSYTTPADLTRAFDGLNKDDLLASVVDQIWGVSRIAQAKYQRLRWSVRLFMISGVVWMVMVIAIFLALVATMTA